MIIQLIPPTTTPGLNRGLEWVEPDSDAIDIDIDLLIRFCNGQAIAKREEFEAVLVPRFREFFNNDADVGARMRSCSERAMVELAARFDAEKAALAIEIVLKGVMK
jgi:hypothetical protein